MALYRRIFPHRDKKGRWGFRSGRSHKKLDYNFSSPEALTSYKSWQAPEFDQDQIRLLVFNECDLKGRKLLFDSKAIKKNDQKVEPSPTKGNPCMFSRRFGVHAGGKNGPMDGRQEEHAGSPNHSWDFNNKYVFLRPSSDIKLLGEMMYGSVAMSYRGSTVKVHTIRSPPELMLSQVFVLRPKENLDQDSISLAPVELMIPQRTNSPARESIAHSLPVAVPPSSPYNSIDEDSGVVSGSSSSFLTPFPSPGSSVSSTQSNSFHRRWMRNQVTSMEHGVRRKSSLETLTVDEPMNRRRHPKIGLGIVISLPEEAHQERSRHFQTFFFSHFTLFEGHFHRLSLAVEKALTWQRRTYIIPIMDALEEFRSAVHLLYCAPRIQRPIWLNMMTYQMQRGHLCEHLMHEIVAELEIHNSKQTNFFFSRLLTAVLMHHLAWVPTVIPAEAAPSRAYLDKHSSTQLDTLAKSHPYNPLWAQLGDIFGAIGFPVKVAKTIVIGRRADVVCRLLYILSYFIRCSEVHEIPEHREKIYMEYKDTLELHRIEPVEENEKGKELKNNDEKEIFLKVEGVYAESADSGLESSCERGIDSEERIDGGAVQSTAGGMNNCTESAIAVQVTEGGTHKCTENAIAKTVEALPSDLLESTGRREQSSSGKQSVEPGGSCETVFDWWHKKGITYGSKVEGRGVAGHETTRSKSTGNLRETLHWDHIGSHERSGSGGLYPDLQAILSATSNEAILSADVNFQISSPTPTTESEPVVPFVQVNDVNVLLPKRERIVAVGRDAPIECQDLQEASVREPAIQPKTFDNMLLEAKREHAVVVGRSSEQVENQARIVAEHGCPALKKNQDEVPQYESWPGHDRSSTVPIMQTCLKLNQLTDLNGQLSLSGSQELTKTLAPTTLNLYPTTDPGNLSVDTTPVQSTENTDTDSPDRTPPMPRRNKRFPLTSPLARAYQEAVRANELKTENSPEDPSADVKTPTNKSSCFTRWPQTTPVEHQTDTSRFQGEAAHPTIRKHQIGGALPDAGIDTRGQQTTPVRRQTCQEMWSPIQKYQRCFSASSTTSSGFSDSTLTDHEELPIAFSEPVTPDTDPGETYVDNFGRSLLGGYSQSYVPDMALHGVPELDRKRVLSDLVLASQHSVLDEDMAEAVCIVADTDSWTVELLSSERTSPNADKPPSLEVVVASCIYDLLESVQDICHMRMPSDFCLMHLEDQLQEVYFKSTALASYLDQNPWTRASPKDLTGMLGMEPSDLPLLLSVISVHSPNAIRSALRESYEMRQDGGGSSQPCQKQPLKSGTANCGRRDW